MKFEILKKLIEGFRGIKDLQTDEQYDVLVFRMRSKEGTHLGSLRFEVLKDGTINIFSDEFDLVKSGDGIPLSYNAIGKLNTQREIPVIHSCKSVSEEKK